MYMCFLDGRLINLNHTCKGENGGGTHTECQTINLAVYTETHNSAQQEVSQC